MNKYPGVRVITVTPQECFSTLDTEARDNLGMTGVEFLELYDRGDEPDDGTDCAAKLMASAIIDLYRENPGRFS